MPKIEVTILDIKYGATPQVNILMDLFGAQGEKSEYPAIIPISPKDVVSNSADAIFQHKTTAKKGKIYYLQHSGNEHQDEKTIANFSFIEAQDDQQLTFIDKELKKALRFENTNTPLANSLVFLPFKDNNSTNKGTRLDALTKSHCTVERKKQTITIRMSVYSSHDLISSMPRSAPAVKPFTYKTLAAYSPPKLHENTLDHVIEGVSERSRTNSTSSSSRARTDSAATNMETTLLDPKTDSSTCCSYSTTQKLFGFMLSAGATVLTPFTHDVVSLATLPLSFCGNFRGSKTNKEAAVKIIGSGITAFAVTGLFYRFSKETDADKKAQLAAVIFATINTLAAPIAEPLIKVLDYCCKRYCCG